VVIPYETRNRQKMARRPVKTVRSTKRNKGASLLTVGSYLPSLTKKRGRGKKKKERVGKNREGEKAQRGETYKALSWA